MIADPRWIYAVPGADVREQVGRQLGADDDSATSVSWNELREGAAEILGEELADGAALGALFLVQEQDGGVAVARASLRFDADLVADAGDIYDEVLVEHRDHEYRATIRLVETRIGVAVHIQKMVLVGDDRAVDYHGYIVPGAEGGVVVECMSAPAGWGGLWGPSLESMVLSLEHDDEVAVGRVALAVYVVEGGR